MMDESKQVLQGIVSLKEIPEGEERNRLKLEQAAQIIEVLTSSNRKVSIPPSEAYDLLQYLGDPSQYRPTLLVTFLQD